MKTTKTYFAILILLTFFNFTSYAQVEKETMAPREQVSLETAQGRVTAINKDTREITLMQSEGDLLTFTASDSVERFDEIAAVDIEEIKEIIRPCGLSPGKSKAIHRLSELLLEHHEGMVPNAFEALEALPGVGHKTASVVMSQAFGVPAFPVDTHIHRLLTRWGLTSGKSVVQTERDAKTLFPKASWNKLHLQIIFYGRAYSPARNPKKDIDYITQTVGTAAAKKGLK